MEVRPIDAEKYMELLKEQYLHHKSMGNNQAAKAWQGAMQLLYDMPTLTPPNEALTLEELREMDGVNALWVHNLAWGLHKPRFMLVHSVSEDWWTCCDFDGFETFCADDYGKKYLLYRRPPEGEEDT